MISKELWYTTEYASPLGQLLLASDGTALTGLWFYGQKHFAALLDRKGIKQKMCNCQDIEALADAHRWLGEYFKGEKPEWLPQIRFYGSEFSCCVWRNLLLIPYGQTTTYGELSRSVARDLGLQSMSAQAIGGAVGHNPVGIIVPCHRVVGAGGKLTGYAGGLERKEWLLRHEGYSW